jgi:hypothetical protein
VFVIETIKTATANQAPQNWRAHGVSRAGHFSNAPPPHAVTNAVIKIHQVTDRVLPAQLTLWARRVRLAGALIGPPFPNHIPNHFQHITCEHFAAAPSGCLLLQISKNSLKH